MLRRLLLIILLGLSLTMHSSAADRIDSIIAQMTLAEKLSLLGGGDDGFSTPAIPRLGVPALMMTDGPLGTRCGHPATAFPAGIAVGATFDPALTGQMAAAIAEEARSFGKNMLLGPCINISRTPWGGRNFESYGEDPFLTSALAAQYVRSMQAKGVLACAKHFALNDQEFERETVDVRAPFRTMFEIYLPPFEAAVRAGCGTVMASYNRVNGHYASENAVLIQQILEDRWGFPGLVVSDWGATHSTVEAANCGLDIEMPNKDFFGVKLRQAVREGSVTMAAIDGKVRRILHAMSVVGAASPAVGPASQAHQELAQRIAEESMVLLKNDRSVLPLDTSRIRSVALIGPNCARLRCAGGGSSRVEPFHRVTPLQALRLRLGPQVAIHYAVGAPMMEEAVSIDGSFRGEYFDNKEFRGRPLFTRVDGKIKFHFAPGEGGLPRNNFAVRWNGQLQPQRSGTYQIVTRSDDGVRVWLDERLIIDNWTDHGTTVDRARVPLQAGVRYQLRVEYYQAAGDAVMELGWMPPAPNMLSEARAAARKADVALVFTGLGEDEESEGTDRASLELAPEQQELVRAVAAENPNTVVIFNSGSAMLLGDLLDVVPAALQAWYPGQEGGTALTRLLCGDVAPSGKLPITWMRRAEDTSCYGSYPGREGHIDYSEGVFVGYRHFDQAGIEPLFPFGHGLTYTRFSLDRAHVHVEDPSAAHPRVVVKAHLTNVGQREGTETVQLYVREQHPRQPRPPQELKGFQKVTLAPRHSRDVEFVLDQRSFAYFDESAMQWRADAGAYLLRLGFSSRDIRATEKVSLTQ